ncbi:MAG TPA: hypothetical protein VFO14_02445 [Vicinamibacterales bacterium]|nr:hypothetical protein [Vicinamibacterales bacterium]
MSCAPAATMALAGQALRLDGRPLMDTRLAIGEHEPRTDRTGRFLLLLPGVSAGRHELEIDGRTASRGIRTYGFFEYGLAIAPGRTTVLPFTIWMPRLDTAHAVAIPSPTTRRDGHHYPTHSRVGAAPLGRYDHPGRGR